MRTIAELKQRIANYSGIYFIYRDFGYIAWQLGTGDNVEIMFIETVEPRKGYGRHLVRLILKEIQPYRSVYVVRLASNEAAGSFYRSLGFQETTIKNLYDEDAVIGVATYKDLCKNVLQH